MVKMNLPYLCKKYICFEFSHEKKKEKKKERIKYFLKFTNKNNNNNNNNNNTIYRNGLIINCTINFSDDLIL
ncbi:hypothetical protein PFNF135_05777 [Plasmodium falciparum NF135/5.C10]|uniref:Uncharacterized protein n=1 Tax=Plasmodium falciparum NF135/5.C10 TaxID=1036726 RepID=W4I7T1_PLAFA|nr:hypothetical protein PFNF135_05777 [Plasmodium falciparum NF135/5.C10]